jgi:hypothetical protein
MGAPERIAKSMSSSLVAGQGASSSLEANSKVQYIKTSVLLQKLDISNEKTSFSTFLDTLSKKVGKYNKFCIEKNNKNHYLLQSTASESAIVNIFG